MDCDQFLNCASCVLGQTFMYRGVSVNGETLALCENTLPPALWPRAPQDRTALGRAARLRLGAQRALSASRGDGTPRGSSVVPSCRAWLLRSRPSRMYWIRKMTDLEEKSGTLATFLQKHGSDCGKASSEGPSRGPSSEVPAGARREPRFSPRAWVNVVFIVWWKTCWLQLCFDRQHWHFCDYVKPYLMGCLSAT